VAVQFRTSEDEFLVNFIDIGALIYFFVKHEKIAADAFSPPSMRNFTGGIATTIRGLIHDIFGVVVVFFLHWAKKPHFFISDFRFIWTLLNWSPILFLLWLGSTVGVIFYIGFIFIRLFG
jgi:hypothetical protein